MKIIIGGVQSRRVDLKSEFKLFDLGYDYGYVSGNRTWRQNREIMHANLPPQLPRSLHAITWHYI